MRYETITLHVQVHRGEICVGTYISCYPRNVADLNIQYRPRRPRECLYYRQPPPQYAITVHLFNSRMQGAFLRSRAEKRYFRFPCVFSAPSYNFCIRVETRGNVSRHPNIKITSIISQTAQKSKSCLF